MMNDNEMVDVLSVLIELSVVMALIQFLKKPLERFSIHGYRDSVGSGVLNLEQIQTDSTRRHEHMVSITYCDENF